MNYYIKQLLNDCPSFGNSDKCISETTVNGLKQVEEFGKKLFFLEFSENAGYSVTSVNHNILADFVIMDDAEVNHSKPMTMNDRNKATKRLYEGFMQAWINECDEATAELHVQRDSAEDVNEEERIQARMNEVINIHDSACDYKYRYLGKNETNQPLSETLSLF